MTEVTGPLAVRRSGRAMVLGAVVGLAPFAVVYLPAVALMYLPSGSEMEASPASQLGALIFFVGGSAAATSVLIASAVISRKMAFKAAGLAIGAGIGIAAGAVIWAHVIGRL